MKFALITEGASEHRIIKHIIAKYFKDIEPEINQIQPKIINDKQKTEGGWNEVLKYCSRQELKDILIENDFLVIQIDTDQSQIKPFDISHYKSDNKLKSIDELCFDVVEKLKSLMIPEVLETHSNRILFAICIHTIECWLLPIYINNNHKSNVKTCLPTLNIGLRKNNINAIPLRDKNNSTSIRTYDTILRNWRRKQDIVEDSKHNSAFERFIDSLKGIELS